MYAYLLCIGTIFPEESILEYLGKQESKSAVVEVKNFPQFWHLSMISLKHHTILLHLH